MPLSYTPSGWVRIPTTHAAMEASTPGLVGAVFARELQALGSEGGVGETVPRHKLPLGGAYGP